MPAIEYAKPIDPTRTTLINSITMSHGDRRLVVEFNLEPSLGDCEVATTLKCVVFDDGPDKEEIGRVLERHSITTVCVQSARRADVNSTRAICNGLLCALSGEDASQYRISRMVDVLRLVARAAEDFNNYPSIERGDYS